MASNARAKEQSQGLCSAVNVWIRGFMRRASGVRMRRFWRQEGGCLAALVATSRMDGDLCSDVLPLLSRLLRVRLAARAPPRARHHVPCRATHMWPKCSSHACMHAIKAPRLPARACFGLARWRAPAPRAPRRARHATSKAPAQRASISARRGQLESRGAAARVGVRHGLTPECGTVPIRDPIALVQLPQCSTSTLMDCS